MNPFTEEDVRASFANLSKRFARAATIPDLDRVPWSELDYLGWRDTKRPLVAYVALEIDDELTAIQLRSTSQVGRRMVCNWCQDIVSREPAVLYVAPRAGASGRQGNTLGTAICTSFSCSANVRRAPTMAEMSGDDPAERQFWIDLRIAELQQKSTRFVRSVLESS